MGLSRRLRAGLMVALLALMINLPLAFSLSTARRVSTDGVDVQATVVRTWVAGSGEAQRHWLSFTLPEQIDPQQVESAAEVEPAVRAAAAADGTVTVRVLPDRPTAYRVEGQVVHRGGLWTTLAADALLALLVLVLWRTGRYSERPALLRMEALADLAAADPPADRADVDPGAGGAPDAPGPGDAPAKRGRSGRLDLADGTCELRGTVVESSVHEVLLDLPDGQALVILDGHANPVPEGGSALARGRLLER